MIVAACAMAVAVALTGATSPAVVGGEMASISDHPWVVALADQAGFPFCDGTLTGPTTVVTAAHCVLGRPTGAIEVVGGRTDLGQITDGDSVTGVSAVAIPPTFLAAQRGEDIATLTLRDAFPYRTLPLATADFPPGTVGTVLGWGRVGGTPADTTTVLHQAQVPVVADQTCRDTYDDFVEGSPYDSAAMFCAGDPTQPVGTCIGDDGGPLVIDGKLAGIVSWRIGCGTHPDYYTRVSAYSA
ncbi:MAG TPA: serine protease [Pseudonocardiaceae bacterium]|nr:serine protease [Pseudonocardiaceae bacterium]